MYLICPALNKNVKNSRLGTGTYFLPLSLNSTFSTTNLLTLSKNCFVTFPNPPCKISTVLSNPKTQYNLIALE